MLHQQPGHPKVSAGQGVVEGRDPVAERASGVVHAGTALQQQSHHLFRRHREVEEP